ncbi:MAG: hypothetical protein Q8P15_01380 [Nanoarchaeota archaeon]|nr:hypothetical protein [Nanoarchaeota archaeon]
MNAQDKARLNRKLKPRVYKYSNEELGSVGINSRLIIPHPEYELEISGTPKNPIIQNTGITLDYLFEKYKKTLDKEERICEEALEILNNPEESYLKILNGFSGYWNPTKYHTFHISVTPLEEQESERILNLIQKKGLGNISKHQKSTNSFLERVIQKFKGKNPKENIEDPWMLKGYVMNLCSFLKETLGD